MKLRVGLQANDFCCPGFYWEIFDIDKEGFVYSECGNAECQNRRVYTPEEASVLEEGLQQFFLWRRTRI